jgi:hypothetical protein
MLLWHLGASLWLFRWIFRDPKVDIRFLLLGALLADVIDLPIGTLVLADRFSTGELWLHSLAIPTIYMALVMAFTRRGRRRRAWMALGVGWLFHLLLDAMWVNEEVFLWPFFGWEIAPGEAPYWPLAWERALGDPWRWVKESIGMVYLVWLWLAVGLNQPDRRRELRANGRLPEFISNEG